MIIKTIEWKNDQVVMLDQRKLPTEEVYNTYDDYAGVANAIKSMVIRGAPAIGVAAAMGVALGALGIAVDNFDEYYRRIEAICECLGATRPTAMNLFWAIERMKKCAQGCRELSPKETAQKLKEEALAIYREDIESCMSIGKYGEPFLADNMNILTHCNAGALATAGYGTALGVVYAAQEAGKRLHVYADETRPFLQGARLTAWELQKHGIAVTVLTDSMAGYLMSLGKVDVVIVGADRIAANGDTANKIGTYPVAVLAKRHNIPFYVAAPVSTIDSNITDGTHIPIEERDPDEVTKIGTEQITPDYVEVFNPAFDVTPADLITAIITDKGVAEAPFNETIAKLL